MSETNHLNGQHNSGLDECLKQLSQVLKALGVEELIIENDYQYHLINSEQPVDRHLADDFYAYVSQMYHQMVLTG